MIPWTWLKPAWATLLVLCPVVFLDKWVNLHFHQILDYESDMREGIQTYAVCAGLERARYFLRCAAGLASLALISPFVFTLFLLPEWRMLAVSGTLGVAAVSAVFVFSARKIPPWQTSLVRELPWPYLSLALAILRVFPLGLFGWLILQDRALWGVLGIAAVLVFIESWHFFRYRYG